MPIGNGTSRVVHQLGTLILPAMGIDYCENIVFTDIDRCYGLGMEGATGIEINVKEIVEFVTEHERTLRGEEGRSNDDRNGRDAIPNVEMHFLSPNSIVVT